MYVCLYSHISPNSSSFDLAHKNAIWSGLHLLWQGYKRTKKKKKNIVFSYLKWREDFKALKSESNSDQPVEFTWSRNTWDLLETNFLQHGLGCEKSLFTAKTIDVKMLCFLLKGIRLNALSHCSQGRSQIQCQKQTWSNAESSSVWENADLPERSYILFYIKPTALSHQENWIYDS